MENKRILELMIDYEAIMIPEDVYDEICIILDCECITFMGMT